MWLLTWTYRIQNYIRWRMNFNWMEIRNKNQDNISALPTSRPRPIYSVFNNNINIHWIHIGYKFSPIARHSHFKFCLYGFALFRGLKETMTVSNGIFWPQILLFATLPRQSMRWVTERFTQMLMLILKLSLMLCWHRRKKATKWSQSKDTLLLLEILCLLKEFIFPKYCRHLSEGTPQVHSKRFQTISLSYNLCKFNFQFP